jgi:hypothetical protein
MDVDSIEYGQDFVEAIETTVPKCDVLIAVVGNNWLTSEDSEDVLGTGGSTIPKIPRARKSEWRSTAKLRDPSSSRYR